MRKLSALFGIIAILALFVLSDACGGELQPAACDVGDRLVRCDDSVTVFTAIDGGGTMGNSCSAVGCSNGARCVAFIDGAPRQGVCR